MTRPNFVLIMTDTQGANMVGCYAGPQYQTPRIDQLAAEGVRFDRAYTTCPVCTPARSALFTGIYAGCNGAWGNNMAPGQDVVNMGRRFADLGYQTAYTGKWHLDGHDYYGTGEPADGWPDACWYDGLRHLQELGPDEAAKRNIAFKSAHDLRHHGVTSTYTWAHGVADRAVRFLADRDGERPFLLVASFDEPHAPCICPPEYADRFADFAHEIGPAAHDDLADKPEHHRAWAEAQGGGPPDAVYRHPLFFACNSYVDSQIGRVLDAVDEYAAENTYVIYTSDHGDMLGAHRLFGKGPVMYEQVLRVPLIVRPPDGHRAGATDASPTTHADLLPTMLELAGAAPPPIMPGVSLAGRLNGAADDGDRAVHVEFNRFARHHAAFGGFIPIRCVIRGHHKLVINLFQSDELYDLEADPHELTNRIDDPAMASVRDELHGLILERMEREADPFRGPVWANRAWRPGATCQFTGPRTSKPADGYAPPFRHYGTTRPQESAH